MISKWLWCGVLASMAGTVVLAPVLSHAGEKRERMVLMDLRAPDLEPALVQALNEFLLTEFERTQRYQVLGGSDVVAMLENEARKQLVGCDEDDCLAQIAGAMDARYLASSTIARVETGYLVNIKVINVRTVSVVARASLGARGDDASLMDAVGTGVRIVTGTAGLADQWPKVTVLPIGLWSGAAAALGLGIGFGLKADAHYRDFRDPTYADVEGAAAAGRLSQNVANAAFVTAALSAGAGLVSWWFFGERVQVLPESADEAAPSTPIATSAPLGATP